VGDSTVCDYPADDPRGGWGQYITGALKPTVQVLNLAQPGVSSKSFYKSGSWNRVLQQKPAWILIQFGHNDALAPPDPRATDARTEYAMILRYFISSARGIGAIPILVTPVRHILLQNGVPHDRLEPYALTMHDIAKAEKVALVDLFKVTTQLFTRLGEPGLAKLRSTPVEHVHFSKSGARMLASLVVTELPATDPALKAEMVEKGPGP
jgi:lysophospholipase L1-like esterase